MKHGIIDIKEVDLIVYDFDGVMTDNRVMLTEDGKESVLVSRADGQGVKMIGDAGLKQLILSSEENKIVSVRAKKLKIPAIRSSVDKWHSLQKYCKRMKINFSRVLYVGNDTNDAECMRNVKWPIAPSDAHPSIKALSRVVLKTKGGYGVARELADLLGLTYKNK